MLACPACMRRYLRFTTGDLSRVSISPRSASSQFGRISTTRAYTSAAVQEKLSAESTTSSQKSDGKSISKSNARQQWVESRGSRPIGKENPGAGNIIDEQTAKELRYLGDPLKLADHVRKRLQVDSRESFEEAQKLVRAASKNTQCVVSWNHLISWQLHKGSLTAALKTYNEMKKRAQFPDAHTYSIIFNGCAMHPQPSNALAKALPIYHSMMTEKSPVKPTVIHVNAILKICARAQNLDAMLAIAEDMPMVGVGSPNNLSYTTIFNALRYSAVGDLRNTLTSMQKRQLAQKALLDARRMWLDITKRWSRGELWVDEELVCSFGRLLLIGNVQDADDILSLIEQTMNIPRQIPRLGTDARRQVDPLALKSESSLGPDVETLHAGKEEVSRGEATPAEVSGDRKPEIAAVDLFAPIEPPSTPNQKARGLFATPDQNTLSLVMEALLQMRLTGPAQKYWQIFMNKLNIQPDRNNYNAYLRILRVARASSETVDVVASMMKALSRHDFKPSTFRIAMAACQRDKLNSNAFANGGKLLDMMQDTLQEPDIKSLETYLDLAIAAPAYTTKISSSGENDVAKLAHGKQILRALERLNPSFLNLKALLQFGDPHLTQRPPPERMNFAVDVLSLVKKMIGAYNLLMDKRMVPRDFFQPLAAQARKLSAFVNNHKRIKAPRREGASSHEPVKNNTKYSADTIAVLATSEPTRDPEGFEEKYSTIPEKVTEMEGYRRKQEEHRRMRGGLERVAIAGDGFSYSPERGRRARNH